ncbi:MAG: dipeptide ABC transporter ATP-binding protein DppD, partial [Alphaproteobacteria bacterium]
DMGVVAETAQRVTVMYAGQQVEERGVDLLFSRPRHPYTAALLDALPERSTSRRRLATIPGVVPGALDRPAGCLFAPRCRHADDRCHAERPALVPDATGAVRCFYPLGGAGDAAPPPAAGSGAAAREPAPGGGPS